MFSPSALREEETKPLPGQAQWGFIGNPHQLCRAGPSSQGVSKAIPADKRGPPTSLTFENFCVGPTETQVEFLDFKNLALMKEF